MRNTAVLVVALVIAGCGPTHWQARFVAPAQYASVDASAPFLKAHLRDGRVVVLQGWRVNTGERVINGEGIRYDVDRVEEGRGKFAVPFADVALVETNQPETVVRTGLIVMGIVTGASLVATAVCIANPKACFGSCPTFFAEQGGPVLAEGFSHSIARTLEATDVDALPPTLGRDARTVSLWMKNEALETHVVRRVRLLAVPVRGDELVLRDGDGFRPATALLAPTSCRASDGDCTARLSAADAQEYRADTAPNDLAAKETVELEFPAPPPGEVGVVLRARNSLVETYVFYQLLAYLGLRADDWFLALEKGGAWGHRLVDGLIGPLTRIEVQVKTKQGWEDAGVYREVGPLAWDEAVLPVRAELPKGPVRVRLTMAKGSWRVDRVALAALGARVAAVPLDVQRVEQRGEERREARGQLRGEAPALVTYPGDAYRLDFALPEGRHQLFLEASGYYYEWMREGWLTETDADAFVDSVWNPDATLRRLAPGFKQLEPRIEQLFWQSRVEAR